MRRVRWGVRRIMFKFVNCGILIKIALVFIPPVKRGLCMAMAYAGIWPCICKVEIWFPVVGLNFFFIGPHRWDDVDGGAVLVEDVSREKLEDLLVNRISFWQ